MNFDEDQHNDFSENSQTNLLIVKDDCKAFSYSCNFFPVPVDTSNMSKEMCDLFIFNVKVLNLTKKLWEDILSILELQHVLTKKNLCYSIINAVDCSVLNKNYLTFNYSLLKIQKHNIDYTVRKNYLDLLDDLLNCMDRFLTPTLPRLLRNVEHLIVKIQKSENEKFIVTSHKGENFGVEINTAIYKYLKHLRQLILDFKIFNVPIETIKKKINIEIIMENALKIKSDFVKILSPDETSGADNDIFKHFDPFDTVPNQNFEKINPFYMSELNELNGYCELIDYNNVSVDNLKKTNTLSLDNLSETESDSTKFYALVSFSVSILGLIAVFIMILINKYKNNKRKETEDDQNNERKHFYDIYMNN